MKFEDVVSGVGDRIASSFASPGDTYHLATASGPLRETGNPFDFAIQGDAWFGIETPAGTVMTRDGRFTMTENGAAGDASRAIAVLDAGGAPIQLDPRNGAAGGGRATASLRQDGQLVGALGLFNFDPGPNFVASAIPASSRQASPSRSSTASMSAWRRVSSKKSNVNPVLEMTRLIMVQRAFENARRDDPRHRSRRSTKRSRRSARQ